MKYITQTSLFLLLVAALLLSGCNPFVAQASNLVATPAPTTPTAAPLGSDVQVPDSTALPGGPASDPGPVDVDSPLVAGPASDPGPVDAATLKYTSSLYHYQVGIPAGWNVQIDNGSGSNDGNQPENVTFAPDPASLPRITIYALTGLPPFTGFEDCQANLVFRRLDACRISMPAGQGPASELLVFHNGDQNFQIVMQYEDPASLQIFDEFLTSFEFSDPVPDGPSTPVMKSYASKAYGYQVNYPADWTVAVESSTSSGGSANPESASFTPPGGRLINIVIYARTGEPPFSGYENCDRNLVFRELPACRISVPAGQIPATELLVFQKGEAYFEIAMQHLGETAQPAFDQFLASFEFYR